MRQERVIITGGTGQLGKAFQTNAPDSWDLHACSSSDLDVTKWQSVRDCFAVIRPTLVLHCAAATDVDRCEREPEWAYRINALGSRYVAEAARRASSTLVHVSTNYVFDGLKATPYHEFDPPAPVSVYGASKLAGEREVTNVGRAMIVRTAWLYGDGRNFVSTMRRLMGERDALSVVNDQTGNPTCTHDLARAIMGLIDVGANGVYHAVNSGVASWYDWAIEIRNILDLGVSINPIPGDQYRRDASPPENGTMMSLALPPLGIEMAPWQDALRRHLAQ